MKFYLKVLLGASFMIMAVNVLSQDTFSYPNTRVLTMTNNYFGEEFQDDYGWMSEESMELSTWVKRQNEITDTYVKTNNDYKRIMAKVSEISNISGRTELPVFSKNHLFYIEENVDGQWSLRRTHLITHVTEIIALPFDARAAYFVIPNLDGTQVALGLAVLGGYIDWKIFDIPSSSFLPQKLNGCTMGGSRLIWSPNGETIYFTSPKNMNNETHNRSGIQIIRHDVGSQENVVQYDPASEGVKLEINLCKGSENLVVVEREGAATDSKVFLFDTLKSNSEPLVLREESTGSYIFLGNRDNLFYFQTDEDAPRGKIVAIDIKSVDKKPIDIVKMKEDAMSGYQSAGGTLMPVMTKDFIAITYQNNLNQYIQIYSLNGDNRHRIELPAGGLYFNTNGMNDMSASQFHNDIFVRFIGITEPNSILKIDTKSGKLNSYLRARASFDADSYISKVVYCQSKDGTRVPISITHKKNLTLDGKNYVLLQVYGAIAFSNYPYFQADYNTWLEMGGIHAVAHIRGGGVYGDDWHKAGIRQNKQNGIDDYIAAIEWFYDNDYSSPSRLVINGTSAGTIPVAGVLTQRPEIIGGAVLHYGMLDMLSYANSYKSDQNHGYMISEIGDPSIREDFDALKKYSPYQHIMEGVNYPPTLALTSDLDTPLNKESYKWIAKMQSIKSTNTPQLLQMAWGSYHSGFGSAEHSSSRTFSDELSFLIKSMNIKLDENLSIVK